MKIKHILYVFSFFLFQTINAQIYSGTVLDSKSNLPLESVSVNFDGTTIGAVTNNKGVFNIEINQVTQATLVVSYIGYEKLFLTFDDLKNNPTFKLKEHETSLDEVVLFDDWSRQKKLELFRLEFLGTDANALKCKIKNEDAIIINYNKTEDKLYASSNETLIIENKALGYLIYYDLVDFEVSFKTSEIGFRLTNTSFYSGTSQFKNIDKKNVKRKYLDSRRKSYFGSSLHFMRVLTQHKIAENDYEIFIKSPAEDSDLYFKTDNASVFKLQKDTIKGYHVNILNEHKIVIRHKGLIQSSITIFIDEKDFFIDFYGIHSPVEKLYFGGEFVRSKLSSILPVDYFP